MLEQLKKAVLEANLELPRRGLVTFTWGNVSGLDKESNLVVIKPSGVPYEEMKLEHLCVLDLNGNLVEGELRPSSDAPTHIEIYKQFGDIGGVVHTHSKWATTWSQAGKSIPCYGTTHADYFYGFIPCTRKMSDREIDENYEENTGKLIVETFNEINPDQMPAVLVNNHGPFTWGKDAKEAVHHAVVLEEIAMTAFYTRQIDDMVEPVNSTLLDKHFFRKHGTGAYYGQNDQSLKK